MKVGVSSNNDFMRINCCLVTTVDARGSTFTLVQRDQINNNMENVTIYQGPYFSPHVEYAVTTLMVLTSVLVLK
jgi:hypothetical protein